MSYKTELHCHSGTVSDCADITPEQIVKKYLEKGYTTVVVADHLSPFTFAGKRYTGGEDWQAKIDYYMEGVRALREAAAGKLHILQGCELRIEACDSDFLVYGMTEEFMRLKDKKSRLVQALAHFFYLRDLQQIRILAHKLLGHAVHQKVGVTRLNAKLAPL